MIDHTRKMAAFRSVDRSQIDAKWKIFDEMTPEHVRETFRLPVTPVLFPPNKRSITAPDTCMYRSALASISLWCDRCDIGAEDLIMPRGNRGQL
jgi:hypothetical protein